LNSLGTSNYLAAAGIAQSAYAVGLRHSFWSTDWKTKTHSLSLCVFL
jgi:hypothetical protein